MIFRAVPCGINNLPLTDSGSAASTRLVTQIADLGSVCYNGPMKTCIKCSETKPLGGFHAAGRNGKCNTCKVCVNAASRAWNKAHPERVKVRAKQWRLDWPESIRASSHKRRALKLANTDVHHIPADIRQLELDQHGLCAYCGQPYGAYHVDHVVALSRGGSNGPENIALACPPCNLSKGSKGLLEWVMVQNSS